MKPLKSFRFKKSEIGVFSSSSVLPIVEIVDHDVRVMSLTKGEFSLIDLIHGLLKKIGGGHVICATWSAGIKDAYQVKWMLDTDLIQSFKLITDHSYASRQAKYAMTLDDLFGKENIRTSEMHAKFCLIHNSSWKIAIRTSMNLNANKTCEFLEIDEGDQIFDFLLTFVEHTFGDMPKGFEPSSRIAKSSLDAYFKKYNTSVEKWWKL